MTVFRSMTRCVIDANRFDPVSVIRTLLPSDDMVMLEKPSFMGCVSLLDELKVFVSYLLSGGKKFLLNLPNLRCVRIKSLPSELTSLCIRLDVAGRLDFRHHWLLLSMFV